MFWYSVSFYCGIFFHSTGLAKSRGSVWWKKQLKVKTVSRTWTTTWCGLECLGRHGINYSKIWSRGWMLTAGHKFQSPERKQVILGSCFSRFQGPQPQLILTIAENTVFLVFIMSLSHWFTALQTVFFPSLCLEFDTTFAHLLSSGSVRICHNILKLNRS